MTDKPFGVNLTFLPACGSPRRQATTPERVLPPLQAAGVRAVHKCTSIRHALKAERIGSDAVSVDGFEYGGT